ncbi:MAG: methylated-DNA--[protein]-cysteine S-methyltransferase [Pseudomonadota bacterium]
MDAPSPPRRLTVASPVGPITLAESDGRLVSAHIGRRTRASAEGENASDRSPLLDRARDQLEAYFRGELRDFDLPLAPAGSAFELRVWQALREIPYGTTKSYGQIARQVDGVARAVGQACGSNPIPIIVPCHRVLAEDGRLGGFSAPGGRDTKSFLLELEGARTPRLL